MTNHNTINHEIKLARAERAGAWHKGTVTSNAVMEQIPAVDAALPGVVSDRKGKRGRKMIKYPKPTTDAPDLEALIEMEEDGMVEATDGCGVEPDGICPHGHPSWLIVLGMI